MADEYTEEDFGSFIPNSLQTEEPSTSNLAEYKSILRLIYNSFQIEDHNDDTYTINSDIFTWNEQTLLDNYQLFNIAPRLQVGSDMFGAYLYFSWAVSPPSAITRDKENDIVVHFTNHRLNQGLRNLAVEIRVANQEPAIELTLIQSLQTYAAYLSKLLRYYLVKAQYAKKLCKSLIKWTGLQSDLETKIAPMRLGQLSQQECLIAVRTVVAERTLSLKLYQSLVRHENLSFRSLIRKHFQEVEIRNSLFTYQGLKDKMDDKSIFFDTYSLRDNQHPILTNEPTIKTWSDTLDKLVDNISSHEPSKAMSNRLTLERIIARTRQLQAKIVEEISNNSVNAPLAKRYLQEVKTLQTKTDCGFIEGAFSENDSDIQQTLTTLYVRLEKYITQYEKETSAEEANARSSATELVKSLPKHSLPKLSSPKDFLLFKTHYKEMAKFVTSDQAKLAALRACVTKTFDINYLAAITDLQEGLRYLYERYGRTADVIRAMIDELLNLDRKSTRLNSSHSQQSRMPSSA